MSLSVYIADIIAQSCLAGYSLVFMYEQWELVYPDPGVVGSTKQP